MVNEADEQTSIWDISVSRRGLLARGVIDAAWLAFSGLAGFTSFRAFGDDAKASVPRVKFDTKTLTPDTNKR